MVSFILRLSQSLGPGRNQGPSHVHSTLSDSVHRRDTKVFLNLVNVSLGISYSVCLSVCLITWSGWSVCLSTQRMICKSVPSTMWVPGLTDLPAVGKSLYLLTPLTIFSSLKECLSTQTVFNAGALMQTSFFFFFFIFLPPTNLFSLPRKETQKCFCDWEV